MKHQHYSIDKLIMLSLPQKPQHNHEYNVHCALYLLAKDAPPVWYQVQFHIDVRLRQKINDAMKTGMREGHFPLNYNRVWGNNLAKVSFEMIDGVK